MEDEYRKLNRYPEYRIYRDGRIYSEKTNRFLKQHPDTHGYIQVVLYSGTKKSRKTIKVHIKEIFQSYLNQCITKLYLLIQIKPC